MKEEKRRARSFGIDAEALAAALLRLKGYRILARGFRGGGGEIDLIASRGDTIAFVEVKARPTLDLARMAVTADKRRRIARAARFWLMGNGWAANRALRGDLVALAPWRWPDHVEAAIPLDAEP